MSAEPIRQWYYRRILANVEFMLEHFDQKRGIFCCEAGLDHQYRHALRPLAFLYAHRIEGNRYHGDASILEKLIRQADAICAAARPAKDGTLGAEWIPYNLMEALHWLGPQLTSQQRSRWLAALGEHLERMKLVSNYLSTAPNHFIWRAALLYRAGQLFDNPGWRRWGQFLARQICKMQTPDGYWDESRRGQGPSPHYHRTFLHGLDLYYRFSDDQQVRQPLYRAIDFAVRSAYPDGVPIETFDGRQPYLAAFATAMAANALSRTPAGRRLLRRQMARMDELGIADARKPCGFALTWYVFATTDFMIDCYRFAQDGPETLLPQEADRHRDGFIFTGQQGTGGGCVLRQGPWFLAVSAAESDVPRFAPHVYITERQSGFSIYHEAAGLLVGGGNRMRNHIPLANAHVITGWQDVDCTAGVFPDHLVSNHGLPIKDGTTDSSNPVKGCYHPIKRRAELTEDGAALLLDFLHARIRFDLKVLGPPELRIDYAFEALEVSKLLLQVPILLFHPGQFQIDGQARQVGDLEQIKTEPVAASVELTARGHRVRYLLPQGQPTWLTYPLEPIKNWRFKGTNYLPDVHFQPLYTVGLLSRQFTPDSPPGTLLTVRLDAA